MNQHFAAPRRFGDDASFDSWTKRTTSITKTAGARYGCLSDAPWKK